MAAWVATSVSGQAVSASSRTAAASRILTVTVQATLTSPADFSSAEWSIMSIRTAPDSSDGPMPMVGSTHHCTAAAGLVEISSRRSGRSSFSASVVSPITTV